MGVAAYNAECRNIVMRYSREWEVSAVPGSLKLGVLGTRVLSLDPLCSIVAGYIAFSVV